MSQKVHLHFRGWRSLAYSLLLILLHFSIAISVQAQNTCRASVGRLGELKMCQIGTSNSVQATQVVAASVPTGFQVLYVLTKGDSLVIQGVSRFPYFRVTPDANYTIHTLVYNPSTLDLSIVKLGVTTGFDVNSLLVQGGGNICAALDVAGAKFSFSACEVPCFASAGTLRPETGACLDGDTVTLQATRANMPVVPDSFQVVYVLTRGDSLVIINAGAKPEFKVTALGKYTIHTLVYNPATLNLGIVRFGVTTGVAVNGLLRQGGGSICAALDVAGAKFNVEKCPCSATAGTLRPQPHACLDSDSATLNAVRGTNPVVPAGYEVAYVLTRGDSLVIIDAGANPSFKVKAPGKYTIHTLVYNPATLNLGIVQFGKTTGVDVNGLLIQGGGSICAALDVAGAKFNVEKCPCAAKAGTLRPATSACLDGGTITLRASRATMPVVPSGYQVAYVLTRGESLVIINTGAEPSFQVTAPGLYTIHTLVYNPTTLDLGIVQLGVTTGVAVNGLLEQGGGSICAALDVAGAKFNVANCACTANAGTLRPLTDGCLQSGSANLRAVQGSRPVVPSGYQVAYVLTRSDSLVIINAGASPNFTVNAAGKYTIHTLVYNPATLDLGIVRLGVTTGFNVNSLLIQGGGKICASLDVAGAKFEVSSTVCCKATAGTLRALGSSACLQGGQAVLAASISQLANVPTGYRSLYVLTSGRNLVIRQVNSLPLFTVRDTGRFTIHTLVYNPATLDLGIVKFGQTTGVDVNGLLIQGGGAICAALDVAGAPFTVRNCPCQVNIGRIAPQPNTCLSGLNSVRLKASILHQPSGPSGYRSLWVLTEGDGLVIRAVNSNNPEFFVNREGKYRIHTLIYNPATLDLSIVKLGQTTGFDVNSLLVQGGGSICAGLDVPGAAFEVRRCGSHAVGTLQSSAIFPNPAKDLLNIQLGNNLGTGKITLDVLDLNGKITQRQNLEAGSTQAELDVHTLPAGMYYLRVFAEGQAGEMLKFSKQ